MDEIVAVAISDSVGERLFYVGASTEADAAKILVERFPSLADCPARFAFSPGIIAEALGVAEGSVVEWELGKPIRLASLLGPY